MGSRGHAVATFGKHEGIFRNESLALRCPALGRRSGRGANQSSSNSNLWRNGHSSSRRGSGRVLCRKHLLENAQCPHDDGWWQPAKPAPAALAINAAELIQHHVAAATREAAGDSERIRVATRGHGGHDDRLPMRIQLVRGDNQARPGPPDFAPPGRFELDQVDLPALNAGLPYHSHSSASKREVDPPTRARSSPRSWPSLAASAHPARGRPADAIRIAPSRT